MYLTWLDSNSWLIELADQRILIDPWLTGSLTFGNLDWLLKGSRSHNRPIPTGITLILLSQGLEDHAHPETLNCLDKSIPIVGSPSAAKVAQSLGFAHVTALQHGQQFTLNDQIQIEATPGSPIGITQENGYLLTALPTRETLYYEPHGYHAPTLKDRAPVDVVITPIVDLALPIVGSIIKGSNSAIDLAQQIQPQVMLPTAAGGDITFEGVLMSVLKQIGTVNEFRSKLKNSNLPTQVIDPKPGERIEISLQSVTQSI